MTDDTYTADRGQRYVVQVIGGDRVGWMTETYTDSSAIADYAAWALLQFGAYCDDSRVIDRQPERAE